MIIGHLVQEMELVEKSDNDKKQILEGIKQELKGLNVNSKEADTVS